MYEIRYLNLRCWLDGIDWGRLERIGFLGFDGGVRPLAELGRGYCAGVTPSSV